MQAIRGVDVRLQDQQSCIEDDGAKGDTGDGKNAGFNQQQPQDRARARPDRTQNSHFPSTLTKGTNSDCHAILFGDFSQLIIGEWGAFEMISDPYRLKKQGMIEITSYQMVDVVLRYAEAFAAMKDARNV